MEIDAALFTENERLNPNADQRKFADVGPLVCESGGELSEVTVAYETWGTLNADRSNAILICHALSGDSHAIGWWDRLVGPGKAIDTDRYFVIGTNALGGCQGTTGPASRAADGKPYGGRFPAITVRDMVTVQHRLVCEKLGIETLLGIAGGSMGGMQALEYSLAFPGSVRRVWLTASCAAHSAMQIGFNETGRQAIMRDPQWKGGDYDLAEPPRNGLAIARMVGHLSYLSEASFETKFGRRLQDKERFTFDGSTEFQVESYLNYQADKFWARFDANSYITLTRAIDYYSAPTLEGSKSDYLITSFTSDWLYPTHQSVLLERLAVDAGCRVDRFEIDLPYGHDAFLLDGTVQGEMVQRYFSQG